MFFISEADDESVKDKQDNKSHLKKSPDSADDDPDDINNQKYTTVVNMGALDDDDDDLEREDEENKETIPVTTTNQEEQASDEPPFAIHLGDSKTLLTKEAGATGEPRHNAASRYRVSEEDEDEEGVELDEINI